jgi:hypothetical protein
LRIVLKPKALNGVQELAWAEPCAASGHYFSTNLP